MSQNVLTRIVSLCIMAITSRRNDNMDKEKIAQKLRELRGDKPRETVANELGISVSALSMYENGDRVPRDEIKIRFANYYNTTVDCIFFAH